MYGKRSPCLPQSNLPLSTTAPPIVVPVKLCQLLHCLASPPGLPLTVTANPFRRRVDHDIGTMINWTAVVTTGTKSVVHHKRNSSLVSDLGDFLEIRHIVTRVANGLDVDCLRLAVDCLPNLSWIVTSHELGVDAQSRQKDLELVVGASVKIGSRDNVVARTGEG